MNELLKKERVNHAEIAAATTIMGNGSITDETRAFLQSYVNGEYTADELLKKAIEKYSDKE